MNSPNYDFFIIGQGLAGSILAYLLINAGKRVLVIDDHHKSSSSAVAAGIINPITGHRLNLTENFEELNNSAITYYQQLQLDISQPLYHSLDQSRLIKTQGQLDYWKKRCKDNLYDDYLGQYDAASPDFKLLGQGSVQIKQSSFVDVKTLLAELKSWLRQKQSYLSEQIDYAHIELSNYVRIGVHTARTIIFCEGYKAIDNPWLSQLPFKLAKGEILTLQPDKPLQNIMLNWGHWLLPNAQQQLRLGSSFAWNDISNSPTIEAQEQLLNSLDKYTNMESNVVDHKAGIRPSTKHRKPFIGQLPDHKSLYCFNGFGSKGCLTNNSA